VPKDCIRPTGWETVPLLRSYISPTWPHYSFPNLNKNCHLAVESGVTNWYLSHFIALLRL